MKTVITFWRRTLVLFAALATLTTASAFAAPRAGGDATVEKTTRARPQLRGTVNLNQADEATLELLPGIGPAKSHRIVEWRKAHPFKKVEDLTRVKGFGRKTLAHLKPYLAVSGQTTLQEESN